MISFKQFSRLPFSLLLLIVFVIGAVLRPANLVAQDAVPAQSSAGATSGSEMPFKAAHKEVKKDEEEDTDKYRHSASVQALAKLLHVDVETAATAFEYINFAVIVLAIGIPLFRILPKTMRARSERLSKELEMARFATAEANTRLSAVEAQLAGLDAEIAAIRKQVEEQMRDDETRIKATIDEERARIVASAEQEIQVAATQARRGLKQLAADLAIDRALSQLSLNEETDRALIAEFARDSKPNAGGLN